MAAKSVHIFSRNTFSFIENANEIDIPPKLRLIFLSIVDHFKNLVGFQKETVMFSISYLLDKWIKVMIIKIINNIYVIKVHEYLAHL